jgi:hypothetical protein
MQPVWTFAAWTTGTYEVSIGFALDWRKSYLFTGYLTQTDGDDYAHIFISTVCSYAGGDVVRCGVRDLTGDVDLGVTEFVYSASSVTVKLRTKGGRHRAEGVVYEL